MSKFFIHRPVLAIVVSLIITIAGGLCILRLPIAQYPQIAPPTVSVNAAYIGANAETVQQTVAAPIEQQVNGVENLLYMASTSGNDGTYNLTLTFKVGTDGDIAAVNVRNRVNQAEPFLPSEVIQSGISVRKRSTSMVQVIGLTSPHGTYDAAFCRTTPQLTSWTNCRACREWAPSASLAGATIPYASGCCPTNWPSCA